MIVLEKSKMFLVAIFAFIALVGFIDASQVLRGTHTCIYNATHVCEARYATLLSGDENNWELGYVEFDLNAPTSVNSGTVVYETSTGIRYNTSGLIGQRFYLDTDSNPQYSQFSVIKIGTKVFFGVTGYVSCLSTLIIQTYYVYQLDLTTGLWSTLCSENIVSCGASSSSCGNSYGKLTADSSKVYLWGSSTYTCGGSPAYNSQMSSCVISNGVKTSIFQSSLASDVVPVWFGRLNSTILSWYAKVHSASSQERSDWNINTLNQTANYTLSDYNGDNRFYSYDDNSKVLFTSARGGGLDLYYGNSTDNTSVTRLTNTVVQERLYSVLTKTDGTVYFTYNNSGVAYLDWFCGSDVTPVLGRKCGASSIDRSTPDILLTIWDEGCAPQGCSPVNDIVNAKHCCIYPNEDWIHVIYQIGGQYAVPSSFDSYNDSTYYKGVGATCTATCMSCTNNPGTRSLTFKNSAAKTASLNDWTLDLHDWVDNQVTVVCDTNLTDSIMGQINFRNSAANFSVWSVGAGGNQNYNDQIQSNHIPGFSAESTVKYFNTASKYAYQESWQGPLVCWLNAPLFNLNDIGMSLIASGFVSGSTTDFYRSYVYSMSSSAGTSASLVPYSIACRGIQYDAVPPIKDRMPTRVESKALTVKSNCLSNLNTYVDARIYDFSPSYLQDNHIPYGVTSQVWYAWIEPRYGGLFTNNLGECLVEVDYASNVTEIYSVTHTIMQAIGEGTSGGGEDSPFAISGRHYTQYLTGLMNTPYLPADNYTLTVSCRDALGSGIKASDGNTYCLNAASTSFNFTVDAPVCGGNKTSCGTSLPCDTCSGYTCNCESGIETVAPSCSEQKCMTNGTCFATCKSIYSVKVAPSSDIYPCLTDTSNTAGALPEIAIQAGVYKYSSSTSYDTSLLSGGASCVLKLAGSNSGMFGGVMSGLLGSGVADYGLTYAMTYDSGTHLYKWNSKTAVNIPKLACNANYTAQVVCSSADFIPWGSHTGYAYFRLESAGFCDDGTPYGSCSAIEENKGLECTSSGGLVPNSPKCGCPEGMTVDEGTKWCSGNPTVKINVLDSLSLTWILFIIVIVPVGLYAMKIMHIFD